MSSRTLSVVAIALWGLSLVGAAGLFMVCENGEPEPEPQVREDSRVSIEVEPDEHEALRLVMQANLVTFQGLSDACARDEVEAAGAIARAASEAPGVGRSAPALKPDLPKQWRAWGKTVHREYARLADGMEAGVMDCSDLPQALSTVTASCVSCHATYRVVPASY